MAVTAAAAVFSGSVAAAAPRPAALHWHSCDGMFQCATAKVPLDYQRPSGPAISIAVIRHRATGHGHPLGSLFFNSGGPAEQIEPFIASYPQIPAALRARFDVVSFDPRGFGFSTAINCFPSLAAEHAFLSGLPLFPVGRQQEAAARCLPTTVPPTWPATWTCCARPSVTRC